MNLFRIGSCFEGQQAFRHCLQMFFRFGNEKLQNLFRNFAVLRQTIHE